MLNIFFICIIASGLTLVVFYLYMCNEDNRFINFWEFCEYLRDDWINVNMHTMPISYFLLATIVVSMVIGKLIG